MAHSIEKSRNHCALLGAIQTVQATEGIVPIVHSTAGCAVQQHLGGGKMSGWLGSGYAGGAAIPSSNVTEKQIVFGGSSRLREQIKNTLKVVQADLYTVLPGCATELVGDDIPAMVKEAQEQGYPVIHIAAPGFKGDVHTGYELVVKGMIEQLGHSAKDDSEKISGLVNVLGVIPGQDVFWQGHLLELQHTLEGVGLQANTLFGFGQSTQSWQQASQAQFNLSFSPWGTQIAKALEEKLGTPYLDFGYLPVGVDDTLQLLGQLQEKLNLNADPIKTIAELAERRQAYYLAKIADVYVEQHFQKEFTLVGEAGLVLGLNGFLSKTFGLIPKALIITDALTEPIQTYIREKIKQFDLGFATEVIFAEDQGQINAAIRRNDAELILGSSLEQEIANELQVPLVPVSFPLKDAAILNKSYIGFNGAITLLEDISKQILIQQNK